jgi:hypothetical protein
VGQRIEGREELQPIRRKRQRQENARQEEEYEIEIVGGSTAVEIVARS